jgi:hypothetical protein
MLLGTDDVVLPKVCGLLATVGLLFPKVALLLPSIELLLPTTPALLLKVELCFTTVILLFPAKRFFSLESRCIFNVSAIQVQPRTRLYKLKFFSKRRPQKIVVKRINLRSVKRELLLEVWILQLSL